MKTLKEFLKPDWKRVLLLVIFILIMAGGFLGYVAGDRLATELEEVIKKYDKEYGAIGAHSKIQTISVWLKAYFHRELTHYHLFIFLIGSRVFEMAYLIFTTACLIGAPIFVFLDTKDLPLTSWPMFLFGGIYLYLFSCLVVSCFNSYRKRFSKLHWTAIIILLFIILIIGLVFPYSHSPFPGDILIGLTAYHSPGGLPIFFLYLYLLFCFGFFIHDRFKKKLEGRKIKYRD